MLFLTIEELYELTGFKLASAQCRWLNDHDYPFDTCRSGKPKVLRSYLVNRLCPTLIISRCFEEPNFEALN